jgi:hypothetical protein
MSAPGNPFPPGVLIASGGPWPFTTRRTYRTAGHSQLEWWSRHHRKRLHRFDLRGLDAQGIHLLRSLWMPGELNWWIGVVFALGALLFMAGSVFSLAPGFADALSLEANAVFFAGSIPFTLAAYLQLFQAANAGTVRSPAPRSPPRAVLVGWKPHDIGWLSCALQFLGTLLFNVNTWDAMSPGLSWSQQDLQVWIPNFVGSVLFLTSGYLAFAETCHAYVAWKPASLSWWVTFANLLGCVAFMISAVFAFVPAKPFAFDAGTISVAFTLIGAFGFFVGSLLMLPETARPET